MYCDDTVSIWQATGTPLPLSSSQMVWIKEACFSWTVWLGQVSGRAVTRLGWQPVTEREGAEAKLSSGGVLTTFGLKGGSISFLSSSSQLISRNKGCWRMSPLTPSLFSGSLTKSCKGAERAWFTSEMRLAALHQVVCITRGMSNLPFH